METYLYDDLFKLERNHFWHKSKRYLLRKILKSLALSKSSLSLDVGCGVGQNTNVLSRYTSPFAIDASKTALKYCQQKGLKNLSLQSIEKTNFKNNQFDFLILLDVLEHTLEKPTLKEIYRILKPGGYLFITVPAFPFLWSRWDEILHHQRRYTRSSLDNVLVRNGFKIKKLSYLYSFLFLPTYIIRTLKTIFMPHHYGSDFKLSHPLINKLLYLVSKIEVNLALTIGLPFGTSVICLCMKPYESS